MLQAEDGGMETFGVVVPAIEFSSGPGGALLNFEALGLLFPPSPKVGNDGICVLEQPPHATSARAAVMPTASKTRIDTSLIWCTGRLDAPQQSGSLWRRVAFRCETENDP